jgi:hypothetical protein
MGEVFIHIGTVKTGTTFLQKIVFPKLKEIHYYKKPQIVTAIVASLEYDKILISDEKYSGTFLHKYPASIRFGMLKKLHALFPNAKIIVTFREPNSIVPSYYSQALRMKRFKGTFEEFKKVLDPLWYDNELAEKQIKSLWKDVLVLDYQEMVDDCNSYVKKICNYLGVEVPQFKNIRINASKYLWRNK